MKNNLSQCAPSPSRFVGNRLQRALDLCGSDGRTLRQKYIIGDPMECPAGTAMEMKRLGYVGLYSRSNLLVYTLPNTRLRIHVMA